MLSLWLGPVSAAEPRPNDVAFKQFDEAEGISLFKRQSEGQELPDFRGEVTINAPAFQIVRVLEDVQHHTEWMFRCAESVELKRFDDERVLLYNRTDSPWPIWDRDVIVETHKEEAADGRTITLSFRNTDSKLRPVPEKVVRMPRLVGFYRLERLEGGATKLSYQVTADPGGSVPRWIAERVARDLPYQTLSRLRRRVIDASEER